MNKVPSIILKIFACLIAAGVISLLAVIISKTSGSENGFTDSLLKFIDLNVKASDVSIIQKPIPLKEITIEEDSINNDPFAYQKGDWKRYVTKPKYSVFEKEGTGKVYIEDSEDVNMNTYGSNKLNMLYGSSRFTNNKYRRSDDDVPVSKVIKDGLNFERQLQLHMEGTTGRRMKVYIDYDSNKQNNQYMMQYKATEDKEVIREINAGEIDIKFQGSKYAVYDDTSKKGLGMDITMKKENLKIKAFGSIVKGETEVETFRGNSSSGYVKLSDFQYVRNTYFQLEPFKRYDNLSVPPVPADDPYNKLITFTSKPTDPETYKPYNVNISPSGFALYLDDQNNYNNYSNLNSFKFEVTKGGDGGYYDKLVSGVDYTINYSTGLITLIRTIPKNARMFAVYTLADNGSNSSDPGARTDVIDQDFYGKILVFIKYDYSINEDVNKNFVLDSGEDKNNDGKPNFDIYEVRSVFSIGQKQLLQNNFSIQFFKQNGILIKSDLIKTGKYTVDFSNGLILFYLREPFRELYEPGDSTNAGIVYSENQPATTANYSKYNLKVDYYREARSFQLKHVNIIPGSVRIKINARELSSSLYSVDYTSGFLQFTNPNDPVIGTETEMEVKYEYLPLGTKTSTLVTGARAEYDINRNLKIGTTVLLKRESASEIVPNAGSEPDQTLILEGDATLKLQENSIKNLIKSVTGYNVESAPVEINAYAEYARSYRKVNTFGKALIDDMESNEELTAISLSDKDWQLASMPEGIAQSNRGLLNYYYYRDPNSPGRLRGFGFNSYLIDYAKKPGPYNIATGHIADSIQSVDTQKSLAFNFEFSVGKDHIPIVTRQLSGDAVDFSNLQYVEIWYRADGTSAGDVDLYFDIGTLNEDSDGDTKLDTEDFNNNNILDFNTSSSTSEDIGYEFNGNTATRVGSGPGLNSYTVGDGVLNTEDLNRNGILDTTESSIRLPGILTTPYNDSTRLVVSMNDPAWKMARIYLNKNSTDYLSNSYAYEELLKKVRSVRLFLQNRSGTATTGTIYIDSIKFVSTIWGNLMINDVLSNSPTQFKLTQVDSINDAEYRANSFMISQNEAYSSLYGKKTDKELNSQKETAIQIEYDYSSVLPFPSGLKKGSTAKKIIKPVDVRSYKTMNMWFNFRSFSSGDSIAMQVGSSDTDYIEYRFPMDYANTWREMRLKLKDSSGGNIEKYEVHGSPDLKRISVIRVELHGQGTSTGKLWLNDIYLSEPETEKSGAYWYEGELKIKRPLYITKSGTPVFSDINIKYISKGHGSRFSSVGKQITDIMEQYNEVFSSANILPNWSAKLDFIAEKSDTDSYNELVAVDKRGKTNKKTLLFESSYISNIYAMPSITVQYKQDMSNNIKEEDSSTRQLKRTKNELYTPSIIIDEKLSGFLGGNLSAITRIDLNFKNESINRDDSSVSLLGDEEEKRQKGYATVTLDYRNKLFYIQPGISTGSQEIVKVKGKTSLNDTQILTDIDNSYHFPFVYNSKYKLVDRDKKANLKLGSDNALSPANMAMEVYYSEYNFRDYTESEKLLTREYSRAKNARSSVSSNLNLPVNFSNFKNLKFIRSFNLYYTRSVFFEETDIPYEGEGKGAFDEEYGVKRVYNGFSEPVFNLWKYPPWYFFKGRGNFANGRDFSYNKLNSKLDGESGSPELNYTNHLRLIDNAGFNSMQDFGIVIVNLSGAINGVNERQTISGIPQQTIVINAGSNVNFDLMQLFRSGFFRPNKIGIPHHSASINIGYNFTRNMLITSDIEENVHTPGIGLTFKRDRSMIGTKSEVNYRQRNKREYISLDDSERSSKDDIYISNMQTKESFKERDKGYKFSIIYETDVLWLHSWFSYLYTLTGYPIFSIEYSLILNRYDYSKTTSPEPYDQHLITGKLTLDLHKNIQGGLTGRMALEKFRDRETNSVNREIISYEIAINFTLIF
ncbi:MAG: hypothetical protein V1874_14940 [Spirochaetota bacterium]